MNNAGRKLTEAGYCIDNIMETFDNRLSKVEEELISVRKLRKKVESLEKKN